MCALSCWLIGRPLQESVRKMATNLKKAARFREAFGDRLREEHFEHVAVARRFVAECEQ
jgi:hypothetical protein